MKEYEPPDRIEPKTKRLDDYFASVPSPRAYADTSQEAVDGVTENQKNRIRRLIVEYIFIHGPECADQIEKKLAEQGKSLGRYNGPRTVTDMVNDGALVYLEERGITRSRNDAHKVALMPWLLQRMLEERGTYHPRWPLDTKPRV